MGKKTKMWLIIAVSLLVVGGVIFMAAMQKIQWNFRNLSTTRYETNEYEVQEEYKNISIVTNTSDIVFVASEDSKSTVICYEENKIKHSVKVKDGTLIIEANDTRKWYEHIGISVGTPKITVCIPQGEYGDLSVQYHTGDVTVNKEFKFASVDISGSTGNIKMQAPVVEKIKLETSTGAIYVENVSASTVQATVSTGKVVLTNVICQEVFSEGSTGDITLKNVVAKNISIERDTGDVKFDSSDAQEIFVKTSTGRVTGTLLSDKIYLVKTSTGAIDVPKTTEGGKCEITTSTGDIKISVK